MLTKPNPCLWPSLPLLFLGCSHEIGVPDGYSGTSPDPAPPAATQQATSGAASPTTTPEETDPPAAVGFPQATAIAGPIWLDEPVHNRATPLSRGTLAVTQDGSTAVAADPDRDTVFVVDLVNDNVKVVSTTPEIGLGQVVFGNAGRAFVAARQNGMVLGIDTNAGLVDASFEVCSSPQGLAFDDASGRLHVACRDGALLTLDASTGEHLRTLALDDDLRDVLIRGDGLVVTRFRSAEILLLDAAGQELLRMKPAASGAQVAWRTLLDDEGNIVVAHQTNATFPLPGVNYYGSPCGGSLSQPTVTLLDPETQTTGSNVVAQRSLPGAAGVVDVSIDPNTGSVVAVVPGNALSVEPREAMMEVSMDDPAPVSNTCLDGNALDHPMPEVPVSVAIDGSGTRYVLTREPATLEIVDDRTIVLSTESREDTGFRMFHMNTGLNVACASCHPDARDDGYTWQFQEIGDRRTQSLEGGISQLAPFHWEGDLPTLGDFVGEVMTRRMGLEVMPSEEELRALESFLDRVPLPAQRPVLDTTQVERGRVLFDDPEVGCANCHSGERFTDNARYDVGTGEFLVTPPLVRVSARAPFMHDGCAPTLLDRFSSCGGGDQHGKTSHLSGEQLRDLAAYLGSL